MKKGYILLIIALLVAIAFLLSKRNVKRVPNSENPYEYDLGDLDKTDPESICYEEYDSIPIEMDNPKAIITDVNDNIYILGTKNLAGFDKEKNKTLYFNIDTGAHCFGLSDELFYIGYDNFIVIYNNSGYKLNIWDSIPKPALFSSLAISENNVYVSDAGNAIVHKFDKEGNMLLDIGKKDTIKGIRGFILPSRYFDIKYDDNQLWIVNSGRLSLENFTEDGELRSFWGIASMKMEGFCGCCNPSNIAILPNGYFVTSEKGIPRIKIYDPAGNFKCVVAGPENFTHGNIGRDIAINSRSEVLILDSPKNKVRIFRPL